MICTKIIQYTTTVITTTYQKNRTGLEAPECMTTHFLYSLPKATVLRAVVKGTIENVVAKINRLWSMRIFACASSGRLKTFGLLTTGHAYEFAVMDLETIFILFFLFVFLVIVFLELFRILM